MKKFNIFIILPTAVLVYGDFNKYSSPFAPIVRNTCRAHVSFTCVPNSATTLYEVIYVASKIAYMYCATNLLCNIHSMPIRLWSAHKNKQNKLSHPFVHGPSQSILLLLSSYATLAMGDERELQVALASPRMSDVEASVTMREPMINDNSRPNAMTGISS